MSIFTLGGTSGGKINGQYESLAAIESLQAVNLFAHWDWRMHRSNFKISAGPIQSSLNEWRQQLGAIAIVRIVVLQIFELETISLSLVVRRVNLASGCIHNLSPLLASLGTPLAGELIDLQNGNRKMAVGHGEWPMANDR